MTRTALARRAVAFGGITVLSAGVIAFSLGLSGHQVNNAFLNISNGLSMGGASDGGADIQAPVAATPARRTTSSGSASGSLSIGAPPAEVERDVVAGYTVPYNGFTAAFNTVTGEAEQLGGYVASSTTTADANHVVRSGTIVVMVPATHLSDLLTSLPGTFMESKLDFSTVDHTADYVSETTNLQLAQAHLAALLRAQAATNDAGQLSQLGGEIQQANATVQQLQGELNLIHEQVTMSSASIELSERGVVIPPRAPAPSRLHQALSQGWNNDIALLSDGLYGVLSALPLLLLAVIAGLVLRRPLSGWVSGRRHAAAAEA